ncbi:MAG: hypothetical protein ACRDS9_02145 [Pseudonocardiaceae bacterium]
MNQVLAEVLADLVDQVPVTGNNRGPHGCPPIALLDQKMLV